MDWTELCVTVAAADTDRAAAIAAMAAPHGLYIEDYRDLEEGARQIAHSDLIDEELLARDRTRTRIHLYLEPGRAPAEAAAYLRERLPAEGIPFELLEDTVREEDWADNWKQYFKPLPVGRRLLIRPTWKRRIRSRAGRPCPSIRAWRSAPAGMKPPAWCWKHWKVRSGRGRAF